MQLDARRRREAGRAAVALLRAAAPCTRRCRCGCDAELVGEDAAAPHAPRSAGTRARRRACRADRRAVSMPASVRTSTPVWKKRARREDRDRDPRRSGRCEVAMISDDSDISETSNSANFSWRQNISEAWHRGGQQPDALGLRRSPSRMRRGARCSASAPRSVRGFSLRCRHAAGLRVSGPRSRAALAPQLAHRLDAQRADRRARPARGRPRPTARSRTSSRRRRRRRR